MPAAETAPRGIQDMMFNVFMARALYAVTSLGIPDLLSDRPLSCRTLADKTGVRAGSLHQVLRAVASTDVLRTVPSPESGDGEEKGDRNEPAYALTPVGETLCTGHPSGTRDMVLTLQGPIWDALTVLPQRLTTERTGTELALGLPWFDYLRQRPDRGAAFDRMMIAVHGAEPAAVARAYDFSWARHVTDIGGGVGTLLLAVLREHPHLSGVLFDLPEGAEHAREYIQASGMADRCVTESGSFFDTVPPGSDAYLLSHILHNCDEDACVRILRSCAAAMSPHSRLLVVEMVLPAGDEPHPGKVLDLAMVTLTTGRERTAQEYADLLARAGLRLRKVVPTDSAVSVLEAVLETGPIPETGSVPGTGPVPGTA
ncbi:methyltransferase [Streptomyces sp. Ru73]|uniref:methyltransferase n=1 Tax=Streptomyces sp. Ru73 TaxID=2080748 RepID=UPI0011B0D528|nr:methyltransferase [Streptomyces sp. Ru73]